MKTLLKMTMLENYLFKMYINMIVLKGFNQIGEARQTFLGTFHKQGGVQDEHHSGGRRDNYFS